MEKHLWKLPIPEFDAGNYDHQAVAQAGAWAAESTAARLTALRAARATRAARLTVTIARRDLRAWLRDSRPGAVVEAAVEQLMTGRN